MKTKPMQNESKTEANRRQSRYKKHAKHVQKVSKNPTNLQNKCSCQKPINGLSKTSERRGLARAQRAAVKQANYTRIASESQAKRRRKGGRTKPKRRQDGGKTDAKWRQNESKTEARRRQNGGKMEAKRRRYPFCVKVNKSLVSKEAAI